MTSIASLNRPEENFSKPVRIFTIERVTTKYPAIINGAWTPRRVFELREKIAYGVSQMNPEDVIMFTHSHPTAIVEVITAIYARFGYVKYIHQGLLGEELHTAEWKVGT